MFKKIASFIFISALSFGVLFAQKNEPRHDLGSFVVSIKAPVSVDSLNDWEYERALFSTLTQSFERSNFEGTLISDDEPKQGAVPKQLRIQIIRWNIDRIGNAQCGISVELLEGTDRKYLGVFSGIEIGVTADRGYREAARLLERAGESAGNELWNKLSRVL